MKNIKRIIICTLILMVSCKGKKTLIEKEIAYSNLSEPSENIYVELLSYYPAKNKNQSNFYIVKNIYDNKDTLFIVDKDNFPIPDFIKKYEGVEKTAIILRKGEMKSKTKYLVNISENDNLKNKKIYLGELIRLID